MPQETYTGQSACHKKHTPDKTHATRNLHRTKRMPQETYTRQNACHKKPTPDKTHATINLHQTKRMPQKTYTGQSACHKKPTPDKTHATRNLHRTKRMPQETYTGQCSFSRCNNANTSCVYSDVIAFTIIRQNVKTGVVFLEYLAPSNISAVEATNYRYFL
jgi:hypothetical protein